MRTHVMPGETVLVTGASGGVGSALIQLARVRGARTVALTSPPKVDRVREIGADAVVTRDTPDLATSIREVSGESTVHVVADVVGGSRFSELLGLLCPTGRYVTAGAIGGPLVELDLRTVYIKHLTLYGHNMGTREDFERVVRYITEGRIRPLLAATFPLAEIRWAQEAFMAKEFVGNLVVLPPA